MRRLRQVGKREYRIDLVPCGCANIGNRIVLALTNHVGQHGLRALAVGHVGLPDFTGPEPAAVGAGDGEGLDAPATIDFHNTCGHDFLQPFATWVGRVAAGIIHKRQIYLSACTAGVKSRYSNGLTRQYRKNGRFDKPGLPRCQETKPLSRPLSTPASLKADMEEIRIRGARTHNLKNINLDLPRNQL